MEPADGLLGPAGNEMAIGAALQAALDADRAGDVFLLEHAFLDQAEGLLPMRAPVGRGAVGGDQHAVRPRQRLGADRIERDQAQVVGVKDGDGIGEKQLAGRDALPQFVVRLRIGEGSAGSTPCDQ